MILGFVSVSSPTHFCVSRSDAAAERFRYGVLRCWVLEPLFEYQRMCCHEVYSTKLWEHFITLMASFSSIFQFIRDLGVLVYSRLKFHKHIIEVVQRAEALGGELLHSTTVFMVSLFVSHIGLRSVLDFCSSIWNVGHWSDVRLLEPVQKRWTRKIFGIGHMSYLERLKTWVYIQFMVDVFKLIWQSVGRGHLSV